MTRLRRSLLWNIPIALVLTVLSVWLVPEPTGGRIAISLLLLAVTFFASWAGLTTTTGNRRAGGYVTVLVAVAMLATNLIGVWNSNSTQSDELSITGRELLLATIVLTVASLASAIRPKGLRVAGRLVTLVTVLLAINFAPAWAGKAPLVLPDSLGVYMAFGVVILVGLLLYPISLLVKKK